MGYDSKTISKTVENYIQEIQLHRDPIRTNLQLPQQIGDRSPIPGHTRLAVHLNVHHPPNRVLHVGSRIILWNDQTYCQQKPSNDLGIPPAGPLS